MLTGTWFRTNWNGCLGMGAAFAALLLAPMPASGQIRWRTGVSPHSGLDRTAVIQSLAEVSPRSAERHRVVQFDRPVTPGDRAALQAAGVTLLSYLGDNAFFAVVDAGRVDAQALAAVESLSDAQRPQRAWKQHPILAAGATPDWAVVPAPPEAEAENPADVWIGAYILFHPDVPLEEGVGLAEGRGIRVRDRLETVNGLVIELPLSGVGALADEDAVMYVEPALPRLGENNDSNRVITQADIVQAAPYGLDGAGVTVLVYDGGTALASHADFGGRLFARDGSGLSGHATHVSGTVGGSGVASGGTLRGMAPAVTIQSYGFQFDGSGTFLYTNPGDIESDYNQAINTFGAVISNNSIGTNTETNGFDCSIQGNYGVTDTVIDNIVRGSLGAPFRVVWANGNERQGAAATWRDLATITAPPRRPAPRTTLPWGR